MSISNENLSCPAALTVAGSDSGGGAGIQADLRAFRAAGVFGCSAIAAVTAQNPAEVLRIDPLSPEALLAQIQAVNSAIDIRAVKTGMLFSTDLIRTAVAELKKMNCPLVVDPVMVSTSGVRLLREDAIEAVRTYLLPEADWITPNIPEAELLLGCTLHSFEELLNASEQISCLYHCGVILKGGHADSDPAARDAVCFDGKKMILSSPRLSVPPHAAHGTGCTFSAAMAAGLAKGLSNEDALLSAKNFVFESLREAVVISPSGSSLIAAMPPSLVPGCISQEIKLEKA